MAAAPTFGEHIRELRKAKGMTQRALAAEIDLDITYLSKIETSSLPPPSEQAIARMAKVLDVSVDELLPIARKIPRDLQRTLQDAPVEATMIIWRLKRCTPKQLKAMLDAAAK